mmetsp:Transcript_7744/g.15466  ORF Transcript_7744/g.15466 Transcript_7744/m.15466 type:complete len:344 (+) Transcript_7744:128-1159(+)
MIKTLTLSLLLLPTIASSARVAATLAGSPRPSTMSFLAIWTASVEVNTSKRPSHARRTNSSDSARTTSVISGSAVTSGPLSETFPEEPSSSLSSISRGSLKPLSPNALLTASSPMTLLCSTNPPASLILLASSGRVGLWSLVISSTPPPPLHSTALLSPTLAANSLCPTNTTLAHVEPEEADPDRKRLSSSRKALRSADRTGRETGEAGTKPVKAPESQPPPEVPHPVPRIEGQRPGISSTLSCTAAPNSSARKSLHSLPPCPSKTAAQTRCPPPTLPSIPSGHGPLVSSASQYPLLSSMVRLTPCLSTPPHWNRPTLNPVLPTTNSLLHPSVSGPSPSPLIL